MDHHHSGTSHDRAHQRLGIAFGLTLVYMIAEVVGGFVFNSLALLADAGHMLCDVMALGLSWVVIRIGRKPPDDTHTFGFRRSEILAALLNGLFLWFIVGIILVEAAQRLLNPQPVAGAGMLVVAGTGLVLNMLMAGLLFTSRKENLNLRSAFLHVISDALGSLAAILAAIIIVCTSAYWADPVVSVFVGLLILYSSLGLVKGSIRILMEGVPAGVVIGDVENAMLKQQGVCCIHDLHIWTVEGSDISLAAHVVLCGPDEDSGAVLDGLRTTLKRDFHIEHTTIQIETSHDMARECREHSCRPGTRCRVWDNASCTRQGLEID